MVEAVLVGPRPPAPQLPPQVVQPPAPAPVQTPAPPRPAPAEPKAEVRIAPAHPKPAEKKPAPVKPETRPAPAKPAPPKPLIKKPTLDVSDFDAEAEAVQKELQQQQIKRLQQEAARNAAALAARANQAIVSKYMFLIQQHTEAKWNRPLSARPGMVTTLRITVLPGGEVANVIVDHSSGNAAFDASAEEAVRRASPLPVPDDATVFRNNFRSFRFDFKYQPDTP
jgi:colicin import membrane protein